LVFAAHGSKHGMLIKCMACPIKPALARCLAVQLANGSFFQLASWSVVQLSSGAAGQQLDSPHINRTGKRNILGPSHRTNQGRNRFRHVTVWSVQEAREPNRETETASGLNQTGRTARRLRWREPKPIANAIAPGATRTNGVPTKPELSRLNRISYCY